MDKVIFSIITVCYNSEKTIERTIQSVLKQKFNNYEYIIVDGKSSDTTLTIIAKYKSQFPDKFIVISEKDSGIYNAMNKGLKLVNGKWICFMNSDDWFDDNCLNNVYKIIENENNIENIYGNYKRYKLYKNRIYTRDERVGTGLDRLKSGMFFSHQGLFTKKSVFDKIGGFDEKFKIAADWDFIIRMWKINCKFYYLDKKLCNFMEGGICSNNHVYEMHLVRQKNNIYLFIDKDYIYQLLLKYFRIFLKYTNKTKYEYKILKDYIHE